METSRRNPVRRLHSRNRQKEYVTPSKRDVLCPFFDGTFIKTGQAPVTNDFYAQCHDTGEVACAYKEQLTEEITLCKRYWKEDPQKMEFLRSENGSVGSVWQDINVKFEYARPFKDRTATVEMALIRSLITPVDLGDFLVEWRQWYEGTPGNWIVRMNGSRREILNTLNQGGRSFWYNPAQVESRDYTHEFYVQARASDDDMYGSVFRFNPSEQSFYTFEWDSGGMGIRGMAIYRNTYVAGRLTKVQLTHASPYWGANSHYVHHVAISVIKNRIKVIVRRVNGSTSTHIATMEVLDNSPDAPIKGAWGPMTASQPSTYFWDLKHTENVVIDSALEPLLKKEIPLTYKGRQGALYLVSNPMSQYFTQDLIDETARRNAVDPSLVTSTEFWLKDTNVPEGVQFSSYSTIQDITENRAAVIAMSTFNYDGQINPSAIQRSITNRTRTEVIQDIAPINKSLKQVVINVNEKRLFDNIAVKVNGRVVRHIPNVTSNEYVIELDPMIQLEIGQIASVEYVPNPFEMEYYRGAHIDTHDKIFKIEGNVLGWHHIPTYGSEES